MIYNLDSNELGVYLEFNLIEARAAAILTPHLMRHAPAVFLGRFPVSSHIFMIHNGQNDCVLDKLVMDKPTFLSFRAKRGNWVFVGRDETLGPSLRSG